MRRYVLYALEHVDTGNPAYNVLFKVILILFKVILILSGILLFVPMLAVGVVTVIFDFIRDVGKAKEYRDYLTEHPDTENQSPEDSEHIPDSDAQLDSETDSDHTHTTEPGGVTLISPTEVNVVNPENIVITTETESQNSTGE